MMVPVEKVRQCGDETLLTAAAVLASSTYCSRPTHQDTKCMQKLMMDEPSSKRRKIVPSSVAEPGATKDSKQIKQTAMYSSVQRQLGYSKNDEAEGSGNDAMSTD